MTVTAYRVVPVLLLLTLAGCAPGPAKPVPVAGTVLIDGKPLTSGNIRVIPADNRPATGQIDAQGRFRLTTFKDGDGCVPGTHEVEVVSTKTIRHGELAWLTPEKYRDPKRSGLKVTIDGAKDDLVIKLSWDGAKPTVEKIDTTSGDFDPRSVR